MRRAGSEVLILSAQDGREGRHESKFKKHIWERSISYEHVYVVITLFSFPHSECISLFPDEVNLFQPAFSVLTVSPVNLVIAHLSLFSSSSM
jgi:hypothetical protein